MKKRICNLNSFSSIIDRIIIENLKLLRFLDDKNDIKIEEQLNIISGLKYELDVVVLELEKKKYKSIDENRTYESTTNEMIDDIFKLCVCNYIIGKKDKQKIIFAEKGLNVKKMRSYILQVRDYLEFRAYIKNKLEKHINKL